MSNFSQFGEYYLEFHKAIDDSQIGKLLQGSIDTHVHFAPQPGLSRRYNAIETVLIAREAGIRGIVLKNHTYPTGALAQLVSELVPGIEVFGSVCLEYSVGGLNPHVVATEAELGAKIVWMPVFCSINSINIIRKRLGLNLPKEGISLLDGNGKIVPEVDEVLRVIVDYNMVLATGHISAREIIALVERAKQVGVKKIVITHPTIDFVSETILTQEERHMLVKEGVFIEYCAWEVWPNAGLVGRVVDPTKIVEAIKSDGPQNCIMSTDAGAGQYPNLVEGMRMFIATMLKYGLSEEEITCMVKQNPARLLGLSE